jgi:hypothetical protein
MLRFAGVLPYFVTPSGTYFICGHDTDGWNAFGGGPDSTSYTREAAREFEEETLGIFGNRDEVYLELIGSPYHVTPNSIIFFLKLYVSLEEAWVFVKAYNNVYKTLSKCRCPSEYREIDKIEIFTENTLHNASLRPAFRDDLSGLLRSFHSQSLPNDV